MTQRHTEPNCFNCQMGWANQDTDGNIESCYEQCKFSIIVDRHLAEYADVWQELAKQ